MRDSLIGLALAAVASCCFNLAIVIQAAEARAVSLVHSMKLSLIGELLQRPRWLAGLCLSGAAVPLQTAALLFAPIALVQPADATGLVVLLIAGTRMLGEPVHRREILAVGAIAVGVVGVVLAGVDHTDTHASTAKLALVLGPLTVLAVSPYLLRGRTPTSLMVLGAALAFAIGAFALKLIADFISTGDWLHVAGWAAAVAVLAVLGINSEMSALQQRAVARVAPIIFAVELVVPVVLGPIIGGEAWPSDPGRLALLLVSLAVTVAGAAALMSSGPVAGMLEAEHAGDIPGDAAIAIS